MKNIIITLGLALAFAMPAYAENKAPAPETKKVCVPVQGKDGKPVVDPKTGKPKEQCKTVKKHKKHEGTEFPPAKK